MHRLVLEDAEHGLGAVEKRIARPFEVFTRERVDHPGVSLVRELTHRLARRPRRARTTGLGFVGIDAAREQSLETRVDALAAETLLHERVEAEPRQMALVEDDGVSERDGPAVVHLLRQHVEQLAGTGAIAPVPGDGRRTVKCHPLILIRNKSRCVVVR